MTTWGSFLSFVNYKGNVEEIEDNHQISIRLTFIDNLCTMEFFVVSRHWINALVSYSYSFSLALFRFWLIKIIDKSPCWPAAMSRVDSFLFLGGSFSQEKWTMVLLRKLVPGEPPFTLSELCATTNAKSIIHSQTSRIFRQRKVWLYQQPSSICVRWHAEK